ASKDHRFDLGAFVLEREIAVAGGLRPAIAGNFAAHAHVAEGVLDGLFQRRRKLGDGPFRDVEARGLVHCDVVNHLMRAASTRMAGQMLTVSRALRSASESEGCAPDPGSLESMAVPDRRCTVTRSTLHRIRDIQRASRLWRRIVRPTLSRAR